MEIGNLLCNGVGDFSTAGIFVLALNMNILYIDSPKVYGSMDFAGGMVIYL